MRILVSHSNGGNDVFNESQGKKFKEAIVAAGDNQKLVDALKALRGAEITALEHSSSATRADLDKAVGAAKVELELAE